MTRASGSKKASGVSTKPQGAPLESFFKKSTTSTNTTTSTSTGLRPATARLRKEKGRPPERTSPRLARKQEKAASSSTTMTADNKKLAVYVSLPPSRNSSRSRMSSPPPQDDPDALPLPMLRPRFNSSASALSDLTSIHDSLQESSELDPLTSEDERAASPVPEPATVTRGTARKRKVDAVPVTPTPTKRRTGRLPSASKKPRLASPARADFDDEDMPILPSSQSDELEISLSAPMDVDEPADTDPWRIDEDEDIAGPSSSVHAPSSPHSVRTPHRTPSAQQTPVKTLDPQTKTRMMLARMKEEAKKKIEEEAALRAATDSDEDVKIDFKDELSDSSSSEEETPFLTTKKGKKKASPKKSSPSPSSPVVSSSPLLTQRPMRERKQATRRPAVLAAESKAAEKRKTSDPIGALLREQKARERKGTGEAALRNAEMRGSSAETEENFEDVEAATRRAEEGIERAFSGVAYRDDEPREFSSDKSKKRAMKLLGAEAGEAALAIIEADRLAGPEEGKSTRPVEIWARVLGATSEEMDVDEARVPFPVWEPFEDESKSMIMLRDAWANNVYPRAINFIDASLLDRRKLKTSLNVLRSLAQLALSVRLDEAAKRARYALNDMARKVPKGQVIPFSAPLIAQTMAGLGLKAELIEKISPGATVTQSSRAKTTGERQEVLHAMLTLVYDYVVEGGVIPDDEIPGFVMTFLLIANDVETSRDLRGIASRTVDAVLGLLADSRDESHKIEAHIAREIWTYASSQAPPCRRSITNSFSLSNWPSIRICRRVAYHLLLETPPSSQPTEYLALPPLKPIIALLLRSHAGPFSITAKTDYYDLEAHADVLNRMLTGMEEYVALEGNKSSMFSSTDAMVNDNSAPLEQLEFALHQLYNKINDTGAAHLDRSSAKSWIQMVQMRVFYQREGLKSALPGGRRKGPRKITDFAVASSSKNTSAVASREASAGLSGV